MRIVLMLIGGLLLFSTIGCEKTIQEARGRQTQDQANVLLASHK
ncbi:hypothetical protein BH09PLA1_BH09PLA1_29780 [soil metagenome]